MWVEERLAALEKRVARLESGATAAGHERDDREVDDREVFWALNGLKERVDAPGAVLFTGSGDLPTGEHYEWQEAHEVSELLDDDWSGLAPALSALGHPVRLLLLREILHGARTTAELARHEQLGTSGQLYHHLRPLEAAGWVRASARGRYTVPAERVIPLLTVLAAART